MSIMQQNQREMAEFSLPPPMYQALFRMPNHSPLRLKTQQYMASVSQAPFSMKAERFHYKYIKNPGPGAYECNIKEKHSSDFHLPKEMHSLVPKQHQWIISKGREPFQVKQSSPSDYLNVRQEIGKGSRSDWSKNQRFNYEKYEKKTHLGPGLYNPVSGQGRERSHTQPVRERASPQTYLKTILRERKERSKMTQLEEQMFTQRIEEANLVKDSPNHTKIGPSPQFKSKSIRFSSRQFSTPNIGPGSYNLSNPQKRVAKQKKSPLKLPKPNKSPSTPQFQLTSKEEKGSPGPGTYDVSNLQLESNRKAVLGLILREQRFSNTIKAINPGPGQYMKKRFIHLNLQELQRHVKPDKDHHTFGTIERFSPQPSSSPFGKYDLNHHDISQRLQKQREYYQRVKQFKFIIPSSTKRH